MAQNQINSGTWNNPLPTVVDRNWELILNSLSDWLSNPNIAQGGLTIGTPANGEVVITGSGGASGTQGMVQFWYNNNHDINLYSNGDNTLYISSGSGVGPFTAFGNNGFTIGGYGADAIFSDSFSTRFNIPAGRDLLVNGVSIKPDSAWTTATLLNSWVAFGGGGAAPGYKKVGTRVYLRGWLKSGSGTPFTLPAGYRPAFGFDCLVDYSTSGASQGRLQIDTSGNVTLNSGNNTFVSLDNISFDTT